MSNAHWYTAPSAQGPKDELVALVQEDPIRLERSDGSALFLRATQSFHYAKHPQYVGEWKVKTDSYAYTLSLTEGFETELLSFQWHPRSKVTYPHVHASLVGGSNFHKMHIPTGRIFLEDVLRLAIEGFGVVPIRDDWKGTLEDATERVRQFGSWK